MSSMPLPIPDLVLLAFGLIFCLRGAFRGTLRELSNLLAWGLGIFASFRFSGLAAAELGPWLGKDSLWLGPATQIVTFLVVWIGVNVGGRVLRFMAGSSSLSPVDRIGGGLLGTAKALLLATAVLGLVESYAPGRLPGRESGAKLIPYVQALGTYLRQAAPSVASSKGTESSPSTQPKP